MDIEHNNIEEFDISKIDPSLITELNEELKKLDINSLDEANQFFSDKRDPNEFPDHTVPEKLIQCAHEIIFTITAHVMEENEKGEITNSKEICTQNYHIPVPVNKEYKSYMKVFFDHLENSIIKTIDIANEKSEEKNND